MYAGSWTKRVNLCFSHARPWQGLKLNIFLYTFMFVYFDIFCNKTDQTSKVFAHSFFCQGDRLKLAFL